MELTSLAAEAGCLTLTLSLRRRVSLRRMSMRRCTLAVRNNVMTQLISRIECTMMTRKKRTRSLYRG